MVLKNLKSGQIWTFWISHWEILFPVFDHFCNSSLKHLQYFNILLCLLLFWGGWWKSCSATRWKSVREKVSVLPKWKELMPLRGQGEVMWIYTAISANGIAKVSVCEEHYFGFYFVFFTRQKWTRWLAYGNSRRDKKNSSRNENYQIKDLHNICMDIFFPKAAFWEMGLLHKPALQKTL